MGTKNFNILDTLIAQIRLRSFDKYINKNDTVLDFGCGYQAYFLKAKQRQIKRGVGVDYDVSDGKIGSNIELKKFHFTSKLPFKRNTFTKVFMIAVLEHIDLGKINALFEEIYRILTPGGILLITTPTPKSKSVLEFLAFKLNLISKVEIGDHKKYYAYEDVNKIAVKSKFKIINYKKFMVGLNSIYALQKK